MEKEIIILSNEYETIYFYPEKREALQVWTEKTAKIKDDIVKAEQLKMAEVYEKHKPLYHLADARKFFHPISPELQKWINEVIAIRVKNAGVIKSGMVLPEEFIIALGVEQLGEEIQETQNKEDEGFELRLFSTVEEAREWFHKK